MNCETPDRQIQDIIDGKLNEAVWEFRLGVGVWYEYEVLGAKYSTDYQKLGKEMWRALRYELYEVVCERSTKKPKEWLSDLVSGDIRNIVVAICSAITAKYNTSLSIALPCAALVVKSGLLRYCGVAPARKPAKSVAQILARMRRTHQSNTRIASRRR